MGKQEERRRNPCNTEKEEQLQHVGILEQGTEQQNLFQNLPWMGDNLTYSSDIVLLYSSIGQDRMGKKVAMVVFSDHSRTRPQFSTVALPRMPFRNTELWTSLQRTPGHPS